MAIEEIIDEDNGAKNYQYKKMSKPELYEEVSHLCNTLKLLVQQLPDIKFPEDLLFDSTNFLELPIRIDKRKDYFLIFHKQTHINEMKEAALYAYWILKFRPIHVAQNKNFDLNSRYENINELFAIFILLVAIRETLNLSEETSLPISDEYLQELMYAFKYWDISKEALILISETLCEMVRVKVS